MTMPSAPTMPDQVHENIAKMAELRDEIESDVSPRQHAIEAAARAVGRPRTLYMLLIAVASWIAINVLTLALGREPIDPPPFFWLQGVIAFYAAFATTLVLVAQTRQAENAKHRGNLEFHLNLLSEQKATKTIALLEELRRDLPNVKDRTDPLAEAMQQEVDPHAVHSAVQK